MYTKIKEIKTGKIIEFTSQQYVCGLYVIIDNDPSQQMSLDVPEETFHNDLRTNKKFKVIAKY